MTPAARPSRPEPAGGAAPAPIDLHRLLAACDLPPPGTPVALGVSGGPDSTALLLLALAAGLDPVVHHVDHGLRPESAADAAWVSELGAALGVPVVVHRVGVAPGPNLEARARDARHAALPPGCLLAHTADDQAETVLLALVRGSGPSGVAAMRRDGRRPLLGLRRTDTEAVCAAHGIVPLGDPMNDDDRFARVRVRGELVPLLADIGGRDPVPLLARHAELTAELADLVEGLAADVDAADADALARAHPAVAAAALRRWIKTGTGRAHPPDRAAIDRIRDVIEGRVRATEIAGGWRVARTRRRLRLEPPAGPVGRAAPILLASTHVAEGADIGRVIVSEDDLQRRIAELGAQITDDYRDHPPLLVGVLKGAFMFMSDLARAIDLPVEFDFMAVSSYGNATRSSGVVRIVKDLDLDLMDRHVIVVEDIVDSGLTLNYLRKNLLARQPASLEICALLVRDTVHPDDLNVRYVGFEIPDDFVIGYGLDVAERYRNLPCIRAYDPA